MPAKREGSHLFVSVNTPDGPPRSKVRKEERSWVTSVQHLKRRKDRQRSEQRNHAAETSDDEVIISPIGSDSSSAVDSYFNRKARSSQKRLVIKTEPSHSDRWTAIPVDSLLEPEPETCYQGYDAYEQQQTLVKTETYTDDPYSSNSAAARATILAAAVLGVDPSSILLSSRLEDPTDPLLFYSRQVEIDASTIWT